MWGQGRLTLPQDLVLSQELVGNSVGHSVGQRGRALGKSTLDNLVSRGDHDRTLIIFCP